MNNSILSSTLLLTLLVMVGLVFFIRASVKDRTEVAKLASDQPEELLLPQLKQYFTQRAYRVIQVDATENRVILEGVLQPSWLLAIFLTLLAAIGFLCLGLVVSILVPPLGSSLLWGSLLSPLAGWFYWRGAKRPEQVVFKIEPPLAEQPGKSLILVTAHRDELAQLRQTLQLELCN